MGTRGQSKSHDQSRSGRSDVGAPAVLLHLSLPQRARGRNPGKPHDPCGQWGQYGGCPDCCRCLSCTGCGKLDHHAGGKRLYCSWSRWSPSYSLCQNAPHSRSDRRRGFVCRSVLYRPVRRSSTGKRTGVRQPCRCNHGLPHGGHAKPAHSGGVQALMQERGYTGFALSELDRLK